MVARSIYLSSLVLNKISPPVGLRSRTMQFPVVLLPHPLSPTRPTVSMSLTSKSIPSTAFTLPTVCLMNPFSIGKYFFNPLIFNIGFGILSFHPIVKVTIGPVGAGEIMVCRLLDIAQADYGLAAARVIGATFWNTICIGYAAFNIGEFFTLLVGNLKN